MTEALIAAVAVVLAAIIALYGTLSGRRLDRIDRRLDRFEDHLERQDGSFMEVRQGIGADVAQVGARIDRLYDLLIAERREPTSDPESRPSGPRPAER